MRLCALLVALFALLAPAAALAWGMEGHEVAAAIAWSYLTPRARSKVEALLAQDADNTLTAHDLGSESVWADAWRAAGHKETSAWHFVDIELDHPDLKSACFDFPSQGIKASQGPAQDCVVDKIDVFSKELADPKTPNDERVAALKYLVHFVADLAQPLHAADNHDRGGNCVLVSLGGARTVNLHSFWDTAAVEGLDPDPARLAERLRAAITPEEKRAYEAGDPRAWALDSFAVAKASVYTLGAPAGCAPNAAPIPLPAGYQENAERVAAIQLEKAGVRLARLLNADLDRP